MLMLTCKFRNVETPIIRVLVSLLLNHFDMIFTFTFKNSQSLPAEVSGNKGGPRSKNEKSQKETSSGSA